MDPYMILGVRRDASPEEIKRAHRKIVLRTHPDTHPDDEQKLDEYKAATAAYEILSDPAKRARYDRESRPVESVQDLLTRSVGMRFLSAVLPHAPAARRDGEDQIARLPQVDGQVILPSANSSIEVPVSHVHQMCRVAEAGAPGHAGASAGDLFVLFTPSPPSSTDKE